uniref:acyl-CoA dehydrogenase family protein n=1 Tax=Streptomyces sp. rh34 TaxID=2034272 RepID=UPI00211D36DC
MNLDLEPRQHRLVAAVRKSTVATPASASAWEVLTADAAPGRPSPGMLDAGLFDWCLVLEETGADCRDPSAALAVRTFLDVYGDSEQAPEVWAGTAPWPEHLPVSRAADGGARVWSAERSPVPGLAALPDITLDSAAARGVADRDLLARAAGALGVARSCLESAQERATGRTVAGRQLIEFQGTAHRLAEASLELALARVGLWRAAWREDRGTPAGYLARAAAAAAVTAALNSAHAAVQT